MVVTRRSISSAAEKSFRTRIDRGGGGVTGKKRLSSDMSGWSRRTFKPARTEMTAAMARAARGCRAGHWRRPAIMADSPRGRAAWKAAGGRSVLISISRRSIWIWPAALFGGDLFWPDGVVDLDVMGEREGETGLVFASFKTY